MEEKIEQVLKALEPWLLHMMHGNTDEVYMAEERTVTAKALAEIVREIEEAE